MASRRRKRRLRRIRVFLRASAIAQARRRTILLALKEHAGIFSPLAGAYLEHIEDHRHASFVDYKLALDRLNLSETEEKFVTDFAFVLASRKLEMRALARTILTSAGPLADDLAFTGELLRDLAAEGSAVGGDPLAASLKLLGEKLSLNLIDSDYYKLSGFERTRAFTVWAVWDASTRNAVAKELEEAYKAGEPFWDADGGRSFYSRVKDELGARYSPGPAPPYPGGQAFADIAGTEMFGWHVKTIFQTNLATVQNRAVMDEAYLLKDVFPFVEYLNPEPVFEACKWLSNGGGARGRIFAIDDPVVRRFVPPLHFNCDTTVVPVMADEVSDRRPEYSKLVTDGSSVPPHVEPMVYEGPYSGKGRPEPFGRWEPPVAAPGGVMAPRPIEPVDSISFIGRQKAENMTQLARLRWQREEYSHSLAGAAGEEQFRLKNLIKETNRQIREITDANRMLTDLSRVTPRKIPRDPLSKGRRRTYKYDQIRRKLDEIDTPLLPGLDPGKRLIKQRRDLVHMLDRHDLSLIEVEEIREELIDRIVFHRSVPGKVAEEFKDTLRLFPTRHLARAALADHPLKIRLVPLAAAKQASEYSVSLNIIKLSLDAEGKIPRDIQPRSHTNLRTQFSTGTSRQSWGRGLGTGRGSPKTDRKYSAISGASTRCRSSNYSAATPSRSQAGISKNFIR